MTLKPQEYERICRDVRTLIPPVPTFFNGTQLLDRKPLATFSEILPTLIAGEDGVMKRSQRKGVVNVYATQGDEKATIYEMGIPVVETGDQFHIDIQQKVPLNMDRDNVQPAFLKKIRTEVINHCADKLADDDTSETWVSEAMASKHIKPEALATVLDKKFGKDRVAFDPNDPEANKRATAAGYTVIGGRGMPKEAWANAKSADLIQPSSAVFPTARTTTFSSGDAQQEVEEPSDGMRFVCSFCDALAQRLFGHGLTVKVVRRPFGDNTEAYYAASSREMAFNVNRVGNSFFDDCIAEERITGTAMDLILHEFAHERVTDHLSDAYANELTRLAGEIFEIAMSEPKFFAMFRYVGMGTDNPVPA